MKKLFLILAVFGAALPSASVAYAAADPIYTAWRNNDAVGGYDVVSFYSGKPQEGKADYHTSHLGADWSFSSQANLDLFETNPEAFVPQYGGHCAWAAANGKRAKGSPENWHIRDGKLYLNYNDRIQEQWNKDIPGFIEKADANWPALLDK